MNALTNLLYIISNALLVPVILGLLFMLAYALVSTGSFLSECLERKGTRRRLARYHDEIVRCRSVGKSEVVEHFFMAEGLGAYIGEFVRRGARIYENEVELRKVILDLEAEMAKSIDQAGLVARLGPMLGLMGTLIPMGPALIGLASGDIHRMASNLVVAFATTVVGLTAGGLGYLIAVSKRRWYAHDINHMVYICDVIHSSVAEEGTEDESQAEEVRSFSHQTP